MLILPVKKVKTGKVWDEILVGKILNFDCDEDDCKRVNEDNKSDEMELALIDLKR